MISIGDKELRLADMNTFLFNDGKMKLSEKALKKAADSFTFLKEFSKGKLIYGINTGFGPMAQYRINEKDLKQLQMNLIQSHCSGAGKLLSVVDGKAMMIARLNSLMKGFSGVHTDLLKTLCDCINKEVIPCIYEHGGVGASGDLVQLAHLALALTGKGEVLYQDKIMPAAEAFRKAKIKPLAIHQREGLALLNGTSAMTGIGTINLIYAKKLLNWSVLFSTLINELVEAFEDHFSEELNGVKAHAGQQKVAAAMRQLAAKSKRIRHRKDHLYNEKRIQKEILEEKVQEYYSLRCVPQILGPVYDTILNAEIIVMNELNSVNDNPVIDAQRKNVFHGGNFHGDYVALEMDKLKIAVTKLAMLSERQLNFLLNDKLNQKLPPFVNLGKLGLNFGVQGIQFTATSTVAECQTLSTPAYIHSIPNNNDNQDIVSMGTNAALITRKVIDNAFEVMAIHSVAIIQAVDALKCKDHLSPASQEVYKKIRKICPQFITDRPLYKELGQVAHYLRAADPAYI